MKVLLRHGLDDDAAYELLADSAIQPGSRPFFVPDWAASFVGIAGVAVRIGRLGKCIAPRFAHRYWDSVTACALTRGVNTDGTLCVPRESMGTHDGALLLGAMQPREAMPAGCDLLLTASCDDEQWCRVNLEAMDRVVEQSIARVSRYMTLKMGDLLCIATDASTPLVIDTTIKMSLNGTDVLKIKIK